MVYNAADTRTPGAWFAPLVSTVITSVVAYFAFAFAALSAMACDSCSDADEQRFDSSFGTGITVFQFGLLVPLGLLIASWALPWVEKNALSRLAMCFLAPLTVIPVYLLFQGLVDWP